MVIVTISDRSSNNTDEFMGIWDDLDSARAWVYHAYSSKLTPMRTHIENDVSYVDSHQTATMHTDVYNEGKVLVSFIIPNLY